MRAAARGLQSLVGDWGPTVFGGLAVFVLAAPALLILSLWLTATSVCRKKNHESD